MKQGESRVSNEEGRYSPDLNTDSECRIGIPPSPLVVLRSPRIKIRTLYTGRPLCPLSLSLAVLLRSLDEAQAVVLGVVEFAPVNAIKRQLTGSTSRFQFFSVTDERSDVNHQRRPQKHSETGFGCMFEGGS